LAWMGMIEVCWLVGGHDVEVYEKVGGWVGRWVGVEGRQERIGTVLIDR
jgi:hypothetical protein